MNELLAKFEIEFGNGVSEGDFQLAGREMYYASGTSIRSFPQDGKVLTRVLKDQGQEILRGHNAENRDEVVCYYSTLKLKITLELKILEIF